MHSSLIEWFEFLMRWIHVIAGISWIGNSFYFMWLDSSVAPPEDAASKPHVIGELWMVHGGGYYRVEKQKIRAGALPKLLHWFKWEATFTWLSGFFLLGLVYYSSKSLLLIDPAVLKLESHQAVLLSIAVLVGSWFIYDALWQSPIGRSKNIGTTLSLVLAAGLSYFLCRTFSGRGAFLHFGAAFATLMVLNVWVRILPNQKKMIDASERGAAPDEQMGIRAKIRSTHNSYLTLPVLFTMVSNHIPSAYSHPHAWVVLLILCVIGGLTRHMMLQWNHGRTGAALLVPISLLIAVMVWMTAGAGRAGANPYAGGPVAFHQAHAVIQKRCIACHSMHPTDPTFPPPAGGVSFDEMENIQRLAERIKFRAVTTKTMPLSNKTGITEEERGILGAWVDGGASLQ